MIERLLPAGPRHRARIRISDRADGDFHVDGAPDELTARRQAFMPGAWTWLRQVHGATVVRVDGPGDGAGTEADASVTTAVGAVLAVQTADCAPVVLAADGVVGVAHAGWRGIVDGVVPAAVAALRARTDTPVAAVLGPVIRPHAYEFGEADLDRVVAVAGAAARGRTAAGHPALDMGAAVRGVLARCGVDDVVDLELDTSDPAWFSHRVRRDDGRQVTTVTLEEIA